MHAYLFIGENGKTLEFELQKKAKELKAEILEFSANGIDQIKEIIKFSHLSLKKPTVILIKNFDKVSIEAASAFLKSLEEPQSNLIYFICAPHLRSVLPTIVSRCQIIRIKNSESLNSKFINECKNFLNADIASRFKLLEPIKERDSATIHLQNFIKACHNLVQKNNTNKKKVLKTINIAQKTLLALQKNGNVGLQLTYFAINI